MTRGTPTLQKPSSTFVPLSGSDTITHIIICYGRITVYCIIYMVQRIDVLIHLSDCQGKISKSIITMINFLIFSKFAKLPSCRAIIFSLHSIICAAFLREIEEGFEVDLACRWLINRPRGENLASLAGCRRSITSGTGDMK